MSVTRHPVRSSPNGNGIGVWNANTENVPAGVSRNCNTVLLGTGRTFVTDGLDGWPPNVATRLLTNASRSPGATYTCVESYCGPTATFGVAAALWAAAAAVSDGWKTPNVRRTAAAVIATLDCEWNFRERFRRIFTSQSRCNSQAICTQLTNFPQPGRCVPDSRAVRG